MWETEHVDDDNGHDNEGIHLNLSNQELTIFIPRNV